MQVVEHVGSNQFVQIAVHVYFVYVALSSKFVTDFLYFSPDRFNSC